MNRRFSLFLIFAITCMVQFISSPTFGQVPQMVPNRPDWWRGGASLELDFLRNRYMVSTTAAVVTGTSLTAFLAVSNGIFSRSSTATYFDADGVMRTAAANEPRLDHDPLTGEPLGYLHELNKTNFLFPSVDLTAWTASGTVNVLSHTTAPDGAAAYSLVASTSQAGLWKSFATASGGSSTVSIYVKNVAGSGAVVVGNDNPEEVEGGQALVAFDATAGSVTSMTPAVAWQNVQPMKNGWYRLSMAYTSSGTAGRMVAYHASDTPGENAFWGAQAERGYFTTTASSYIPTTIAAVGRSQDAFNMSDAINLGWASPDGEGTIYVSGAIYELPWAANYWPGFFNFAENSDSGNTIHMRTKYYPNNNFYIELFVGGASRGGFAEIGECLASAHQAKNRTRMAFAFQSGNLRGACGGVLDGAASTYAALPLPLFNRLSLGRSRASYMRGHIRHFTYFPYRAPDYYLEEITRYPGD